MGDISHSLHRIGLPWTVRWTHLETMCCGTSLNFTLGNCCHFRASLDKESKAVVSALAGLHNNADKRSVELHSALDVQQFLLGEVCRQIVLTFGDIASAWTRSTRPERCFKVDLVPPAIYLYGAPKSTPSLGDSLVAVGDADRIWEVRVSADRKVSTCVGASHTSSIPPVGHTPRPFLGLSCTHTVTFAVYFMICHRLGCRSPVAIGQPRVVHQTGDMTQTSFKSAVCHVRTRHRRWVCSHGVRA